MAGIVKDFRVVSIPEETGDPVPYYNGFPPHAGGAVKEISPNNTPHTIVSVVFPFELHNGYVMIVDGMLKGYTIEATHLKEVIKVKPGEKVVVKVTVHYNDDSTEDLFPS
jgi:hypothetical protein